jgi:hypothetical protein
MDWTLAQFLILSCCQIRLVLTTVNDELQSEYKAAAVTQFSVISRNLAADNHKVSCRLSAQAQLCLRLLVSE